MLGIPERQGALTTTCVPSPKSSRRSTGSPTGVQTCCTSCRTVTTPELAQEHKKLDEQIARLWDEQRSVRASIRFGDRDLIIQRARHEERLSRAA